MIVRTVFLLTCPGWQLKYVGQSCSYFRMMGIKYPNHVTTYYLQPCAPVYV